MKTAIHNFLILMFLIFSANAFAVEKFTTLESSFTNLTANRIDHIKPGSRPFILSQNKRTKTVVMIHGLSDSPGSMKEVAKVYFSQGYNVLTVLLRDHGLDESLRDEARKNISLNEWREDIDQVLAIAFDMSDTHQIGLVGYSLGGALATDTLERYQGRVSSLVLMAPLFKMNHDWAIMIAKLFRNTDRVITKNAAETEHFYPDFLFNQLDQTYKLTKIVQAQSEEASDEVKSTPKMMFLTDADTTIVNSYAYDTAEMINIPKGKVIMYKNKKGNPPVLHRDLPMSTINATNSPNPHLSDMLSKLETFLKGL